MATNRKIEERLRELVRDGHIISYRFEDDGSLVIAYPLQDVPCVERMIDIGGKDLKTALSDSADELGTDVDGCLTGGDDFYGYGSSCELERRISVETWYLRHLSELV